MIPTLIKDGSVSAPEIAALVDPSHVQHKCATSFRRNLKRMRSAAIAPFKGCMSSVERLCRSDTRPRVNVRLLHKVAKRKKEQVCKTSGRLAGKREHARLPYMRMCSNTRLLSCVHECVLACLCECANLSLLLLM